MATTLGSVAFANSTVLSSRRRGLAAVLGCWGTGAAAGPPQAHSINSAVANLSAALTQVACVETRQDRELGMRSQHKSKGGHCRRREENRASSQAMNRAWKISCRRPHHDERWPTLGRSA